MRRRLRDQGFARGFIGKVGLEISGIHQFASQRIPGLGRAARVENHGKAVSSETSGDGGANAGRCAGDERDWPILFWHKAAPLTSNYQA